MLQHQQAVQGVAQDENNRFQDDGDQQAAEKRLCGEAQTHGDFPFQDQGRGLSAALRLL
jgi:hypothetical protein